MYIKLYQIANPVGTLLGNHNKHYKELAKSLWMHGCSYEIDRGASSSTTKIQDNYSWTKRLTTVVVERIWSVVQDEAPGCFLSTKYSSDLGRREECVQNWSGTLHTLNHSWREVGVQQSRASKLSKFASASIFIVRKDPSSVDTIKASCTTLGVWASVQCELCTCFWKIGSCSFYSRVWVRSMEQGKSFVSVTCIYSSLWVEWWGY